MRLREIPPGEVTAKGRLGTFALLAFFLALLELVATAQAVGPPASVKRQGLASKKEHRMGQLTARSETGQNAEAHSTVRTEGKPSQKLLVTVMDENGVGVRSARVILTHADHADVFRCETDYAGRCELKNLASGLYRLRVEKEGFFAVIMNEIRVGATEGADITLNHQQEFVESVNVVYSPPAIDPVKTAVTENLSASEIVNLPYAVTRDIRYALPLLPGVLQDGFGQIHVDGSSTRQVFDQLDGFNITDPVNGLFNVRVSVDALRSVEVQSSRYPVEFGKGSGGSLSLTTGMGDDRLRFSSTDFFPSLQSRKGIHVKTWTPRATLAGPLRRGKAWFLEALDGEYDLDLIPELPSGADRNTVWRMSNLARTQINLRPGNSLTGGFLVNRFRSPRLGLSRFDPLESTVKFNDSTYLLTLKDQAFLASGLLMEIGVGLSRFHSNERPRGDLTYQISPEGTSGNFFESTEARATRLQWIANLFLPPVQWKGRHEFKIGMDLDRVTYEQSFRRNPFLILREDGSLSRRVVFFGNPSLGRNNFEASGYAQDRWSHSDRWLVESGVRFDRDGVVRSVLVSPRLATSYLATRNGNTKITSGIGLYYDASSLEFITRPLTGQRMDFFFDPAGQNLVRAPVETSFQVNERNLKEPRFLNWSVGAERKLPGSTYLRVEFVQKRGRNGWTFLNQGSAVPGGLSGSYTLRNERHDRYDALAFVARRAFKGDHVVFASYTRSAARSNAVLNFNLDNPLFSPQAGGPLPWDSPNRFISWGWLPLWWRSNLAYSLDWRDGFPFSLFNQDQQLVGSPGSRRFPTYFSLNLHVERRFRVLGFQWALRAGFNDITNRHNPTVVNSNVDSPHFLTFGGLEGRALTARIRLLGRKG